MALPVRDGGARFGAVLAALAGQTVAHELLVCDSGSRDGSPELARRHGARVLEIPAAAFGHGRVRNLLMQEAGGEHVALLSQDAEPAAADWLEALLGGFALAPDVAIVYGPDRPRPDASTAVRIELERWFGSLAPEGRPTVQRLDPRERDLPAVQLVGARGFFTDANACVARRAWREVPFRDVAYAEDRALALDMLRAGYAKAFVPAAAVLHSHDYTPVQELRRGFDEWRGLLEVYGWREPASPADIARRLRGELGAARREAAIAGMSPRRRLQALAAVGGRSILRLTGAMLGSRADSLAPAARSMLSLEGRGSFVGAQDLESPAPAAGTDDQTP